MRRNLRGRRCDQRWEGFVRQEPWAQAWGAGRVTHSRAALGVMCSKWGLTATARVAFPYFPPFIWLSLPAQLQGLFLGECLGALGNNRAT